MLEAHPRDRTLSVDLVRLVDHVRTAETPDRPIGLSRHLVSSYAEAAMVLLEPWYPPPETPGEVVYEASPRRAVVHWRAQDAQVRGSYEDDHDAISAGAYAMVFAALIALGYRIPRRAFHGSGADYIVTRPGEPDNDFIRLEVSGLLQGSNADVVARVREKLAQLERGRLARPGLAAVARFADSPRIALEPLR